MPKIKWNQHTKVQNKAVGLPGPDAVYAAAGDELEVSAKALEAIRERYGEGAFTVIEDEKPKAKPKGKKEDHESVKSRLRGRRHHD